MKKLNLAIIGQGRSGKDIHGSYYIGENNKYYNVKYVVEADAERRAISEERYPGCVTFADYTELFNCTDIDLVVNASYSEMHAPITMDLLNHGFNVMVEKPFGRTAYECREQIRLAKEKGVLLAVFQQSLLAPNAVFARELVKSGKLGRITQIDVKYNGLARRWDWQTLQKRCAGNAFNTGPHPIGIGLSLIDFDPNTRVAYSRLDRALNSGDADDFVKIILDAPGKPVVDIEASSTDAYTPYNIKIQGTKGTFKATVRAYEMTYIVDGENPEQPVQENFIHGEDSKPIYCTEQLVKHTEEGKFEGTAFNVGTAAVYEDVYYAITEGKPMRVTPEMAMQTISVIETAHAQNPLPLKY